MCPRGVHPPEDEGGADVAHVAEEVLAQQRGRTLHTRLHTAVWGGGEGKRMKRRREGKKREEDGKKKRGRGERREKRRGRIKEERERERGGMKKVFRTSMLML